MSKTTNYGLYITDDSSETFLNWRKKMNGLNESNIIKIDRLLGQKADQSSYVEHTLLANEWEELDGKTIQSLNIEGLKANQNGNISLSPLASAAEREEARNAILAIHSQAEGILTIVADGETPTINIPVVITMID